MYALTKNSWNFKSMSDIISSVIIYGFPEYPQVGEKSRIKVGVTTDKNVSKRFHDALGHRPDLNIDSIHKREIKFDPAIFRPTGTSTFLVKKITGKNVEPDEFIHKLLRLKGYKNPDKGNQKGKHENSEVFIDLDWKVVDECITIAINNSWDYNKCCKIIRKNKPSIDLYLWQLWNIARRKDTREILSDEPVIAEYSCPRFGKTNRELYDFYKSDKSLLILAQYNLSAVTSFITEVESWSEFSDFETYDATDLNVNIEDLPTDLTSGKKIIAISLCGEKDRDKYDKFCEHVGKYATANKTIIKMDEVDFGSTTEKSKYKIAKLNSAIPGVQTDIFSGTGEEKVNYKLDINNRVRASAITTSYVELLHIRDGRHYLFTPEYKNSLDPVRNRYELEFINSISTANFRDPNCLVNPVFCELKIDKEIIKEIEKVHAESGDEDPRLGFSYTKINKLPLKYATVHQNIWKRFLGVGKLKGSNINYSTCTHGKPLRVIMAWTSAGSGMTKKRLRELAEVLNNDIELSDHWIFYPVCGHVGVDKNGKAQKWGAFTKGGTTAANNREAEKLANREIDRAKAAGKGIVFLAMSIGQRSFSVSRIDSVVIYRDDLSLDSAEQKMSRVLTPGIDYYGNEKKKGYIFNFSLTPKNSVIQNYIFNEINEQARNGITARNAATRFFEVIDVFEQNEMGMIEKKCTFDNSDYVSYAKACRGMYARGEIRDMALTLSQGDKNMDKFMEVVKCLSSLAKSKREEDILSTFVEKARATDAKRSKTKRDDEDIDECEEDENSFTNIMILVRKMIYDSVLNNAAIYCYVNKCKLADLEKNKIGYIDIIKFIIDNKEANELFCKHFGFDADKGGKVLSYIYNLNIHDKLTTNLYAVISETSFDKGTMSLDINDFFYIHTGEGRVHTSLTFVNDSMTSLMKDIPDSCAVSRKYADFSCQTGTFLRWIHKKLQTLGVTPENIQKQIFGMESDPVHVIVARHFSGVDNIVYNNLLDNHPCAIYGDMKFEDFIIVGNPPYQKKDAGFGASAMSLYDKFVDFSKSLNPEYICMITPSRWFTGGKGLDSFRDSMLNDPQIRLIEDFPGAKYRNGEDIFPDASIEGGVSYFVWKRNSSGLCIFNGTPRNLNEECQKGVLVRYNSAIPILRKVYSHCKTKNIATFDTKVVGRNPFGLSTKYKGTATKNNSSLRLWSNGCSDTYVEISEVNKGDELIPKWKVLLTKAYGGSGCLPHKICGNPIIAAPNEVCTDTYLVIDYFDTEEEARNLQTYIRTKFFRFMLAMLKTTQDANKNKFSLVPVMDTDEVWTDERLYKFFGLSQEEQRIVETMILDMPME